MHLYSHQHPAASLSNPIQSSSRQLLFNSTQPHGTPLGPKNRNAPTTQTHIRQTAAIDARRADYTALAVLKPFVLIRPSIALCPFAHAGAVIGPKQGRGWCRIYFGCQQTSRRGVLLVARDWPLGCRLLQQGILGCGMTHAHMP